jgi:signal transduction histidine kinase
LLRRPDPRAAQGLAVFAAAIAWVAVLGYATDLGPLATVSAFGTVSLPTAAALALAAAGTLLARSGEGLLVALGRKDSASLLVRRLGPVVLLVPAVAGWASSHASRAWQPGFGPAVAATVNALAFGAVLLHTAAAVRTEALAREEVAAARDALARRLVDATERERAHLARELHDHFGQALITLTLLAERLPHAEGRPIREGLGALGDDLRRVALTLRPPLLDVLGPVEAIRVHAEGWSTATSIPVAIECAADELKVPDHIAVTAYRIVQEALNNVARHAGASSVRLRIDLSKAQLHVRVADDGKGFETTAVEADRTGLAGIVERARLQMGTATILSGPQGTIVDVHLPVPS